MRTLTLARAGVADIPFIQNLEKEAFGLSWDRATFERELCRANGSTVIARVGDLRLGSALLVWAGDEVQLNSMVLAPQYRGQGYSRDFLGQLLAWCQKELFSWMTLEVRWSNSIAMRLYHRLGFVTTACRKAYYRDGEDARLMWAGHFQSPGFLRRLERFSNLDLELRLSP